MLVISHRYFWYRTAGGYFSRLAALRHRLS